MEENLYKKCYDIYYLCGGSKRIIKELIVNTELSFFTVINNTLKYMKEYLQLKDEEIIEMIRPILDYEIKNTIIYSNDLILDMVKANTVSMVNLFDQEWVQTNLKYLIEKYNFDKNQEESKLNSENVISTNENTEKENEKVESILEFKKNRISSKDIVFAKELITSFVISNYYDKRAFCRSYRKNVDSFDKYVLILQIYDEKLYQKYIEKLNLGEEISSLPKDIIMLVIDKIINGVEKEDGTIRNFNLFDYYELTKLSLNQFFFKAKKVLDERNLKILKKFIDKNSNIRLLNETTKEVLINQKFVYEAKFDSKNKIIEGSGREATLEEKRKVMNYLEDNNFPLYDALFVIALRKYINGELEIEQKKKLNLTNC